MSLATTIVGVCPWIGIEVPAAIFASQERDAVELLETANNAIAMIANEYDWQRLKVKHTITGDGLTASFNLPSNYLRMLKKGQIWSSDFPTCPLSHVTDTDQWLGDELRGDVSAISRWTIFGNQIHFNPAPQAGSTVNFFYIRNELLSSGLSVYSNDGDTFVLDEMILKWAIVWTWKEAKGQDSAPALGHYNHFMSTAIGNDKGSKVLVTGRTRYGTDADIAYPFPLG